MLQAISHNSHEGWAMLTSQIPLALRSDEVLLVGEIENTYIYQLLHTVRMRPPVSIFGVVYLSVAVSTFISSVPSESTHYLHSHKHEYASNSEIAAASLLTRYALIKGTDGKAPVVVNFQSLFSNHHTTRSRR